MFVALLQGPLSPDASSLLYISRYVFMEDYRAFTRGQEHHLLGTLLAAKYLMESES